MSIENIGAYSPDIVYGQLTTPFLDKQFTLNAHTPYDKVDDAKKTFSQSDFSINMGTTKWQVIEDIRDMKANPFKDQQSHATENETPEFPPKSISSFQVSTLNNDSELVYKALKGGYTAKQAIAVGKAHSAYFKIINQDKNLNPVDSLNGHSYQVR